MLHAPAPPIGHGVWATPKLCRWCKPCRMWWDEGCVSCWKAERQSAESQMCVCARHAPRATLMRTHSAAERHHKV